MLSKAKHNRQMYRCGSQSPIAAEIDGRKLKTLQCVRVDFSKSLIIERPTHEKSAKHGSE